MKKIKESLTGSVWQWTAMKYVLYGALFIIPLFVGTNHWFPFSAPKALLIHITAGVLLVLFGWGLLVQKSESISWRITPIHGALGLFLLVVTLGAIVGIDQHNSFFGVWSQSISLVLLYSVSIIACLVGFLVKRDREIIPQVLTIAFASGVIFSLISYFGKILVPASRVGSTLGNSSFAGAYLLFIICFGIGLLFWYKKPWQRVLVGLGIVTILFTPIFFNHELFRGIVSWGEAFKNPTLFMGQANAAVVGVVIAVLMIVGLWLTSHSKKWVSRIGVGCVMIILATVFATGIVVSNPESSLHQKIVEQKSSNRFLFWDIANSGFAERPLLGNGFNNYIYIYHDYFKKDFYELGNPIELWTNQPHNVFWEYMSTTGVVGTVSFLAVLVSACYLLYVRNPNNDQESDRYHILKIVVAGGLVGYFVHNLFGFDVPITYLVLFIVIGIAMGVSQYSWNSVVPNRYYLKQVFGIIMIGLGMLMIIFLGILPWQESKQWRLATGKSNIVNNFQVLETLQGISRAGGVADSAFLVDIFFSKYQKDIIDHIQKTKSVAILENLEKFLEQEILRQPNNLRSRLVLARIMMIHMLLDAKRIDDLWVRAQSHLEKVHELNSQNPDYYFEMGHMYLIKNDLATARGFMRAGIALAPQYGDGYRTVERISKAWPNQEFDEYFVRMKERWGIGLGAN